MRTIATLLCTLLMMTVGHAQKARLSLNLEEGKTYRQVTHSKSAISQEVYGQKMNIVVTIDGSMSFLVNVVTKTAYDMTAQYDSMKISMEMPQGSMEINSENAGEDDMFSQLLAEMKKIPFKIQMDRMGKILEMENVDASWESAIDLYDQIPEAQREQIKSQLMEAYGAKARSSSIEMVTAIFPEKSVKKGAQWSNITSHKSGMSLTLSNTYTYEGNEAELAIIDVQSTIETDKDAWKETNGMNMRNDFSGTMNAKIKLNRKSGWTSEAIYEQTLVGKTYIKDSEQVQGEVEIPMTIMNETRINDLLK